MGFRYIVADSHTHTNIGEADSSLFGVYGFVASLSTDEAGVGNSDPFAMVFNFGVEEEKFETGVGAFANMVPEPAGFTPVLSACALMLGCIRRRRGICSKNH